MSEESNKRDVKGSIVYIFTALVLYFMAWKRAYEGIEIDPLSMLFFAIAAWLFTVADVFSNMKTVVSWTSVLGILATLVGLVSPAGYIPLPKVNNPSWATDALAILSIGLIIAAFGIKQYLGKR